MPNLIISVGLFVLDVTIIGAAVAYTCGVTYVVLAALKAVVKK